MVIKYVLFICIRCLIKFPARSFVLAVMIKLCGSIVLVFLSFIPAELAWILSLFTPSINEKIIVYLILVTPWGLFINK